MLNRRALLRRAAVLTGGALAAPLALGVLQSCERDAAAGTAFEPQYFTREEADFISAYVDTLLPRTDTPGGLDVGVDRFIDRVMAATAGPRPAQPEGMTADILAFDDAARAKYGRPFAQLTTGERGERFAAAEQRSARYNPQVWGTTVGEQPPVDFYRSFKSFVLWGYLSSETIGTEVLNYDPVPGAYDGDIALASVGGRAWSL